MASLNSNARTEASDVKEIFNTDLDDEELRNWINVAAESTDDVEDADVGNELSDTRLELIEMNLAAHYASAQDPRISSETVGDAQFRYKGTRDTTDYWITAVQLDTTDTLSLETGKAEASIDVLDGRGID